MTIDDKDAHASPKRSGEDLAAAFSDADAVSRYADGPVRLVPGFHHLQRMSAQLLAEHVPAEGRVLVVGAGGGLELKVFAELYSGWRFDGVDPSAEMLGLARQTLGTLASRADLHHGYIENAPRGPFDGATSLLTLHFLPREDRLRTLVEIRKRLAPGAPLVLAHHSFPQGAGEKELWLNRFAAFGIASGFPETLARQAIQGIGERLPVLSPEQDEALLREAGFGGVSLFYAALTFRGWVAYAP
ncbi:tRNA (cmo5U34)-methyltransferase [Hoeflea marina]|uniref:tRNA (Cmo5U34)-methyltransferase n=1 Tax=Hoeflea marina TaxID=274592 RepID=A0A317PPP7_9HYPH|nr:class I SAM-dependent methyltransferase [Hoeflea marina]PWW03432.1 tRNA (cmo5U34)-methyltransferase [Hoeflea marina]